MRLEWYIILSLAYLVLGIVLSALWADEGELRGPGDVVVLLIFVVLWPFFLLGKFLR